jgi:hypothetical protein
VAASLSASDVLGMSSGYESIACAGMYAGKGGAKLVAGVAGPATLALGLVSDVDEGAMFKLEKASVTAAVTVLNGLDEDVSVVPNEPALPKRALPNPALLAGAALPSYQIIKLSST